MRRSFRFLLALVAVLISCIFASSALAGTYAFYGPWGAGGSPIWATNTSLQNPTTAGDAPGANWLQSGHLIDAGQGTIPGGYGDYCTYYGLVHMTASDQWDLSPYTGFQTPSTSAYQMTNATAQSTGCQESNTHWGFWINATDPGNSSPTSPPNTCFQTCGMQHSVSLGANWWYPWSMALNPTFHLGTYYQPKKYSQKNVTPSYAGAHGYLCTWTVDTSSGSVQGYQHCFMPWGTKPPVTDVNGTCYQSGAYPECVSIDHPGSYIVWSYFGANTSLGTNEGATTIFDGSVGSNNFYQVAITPSNMWNVAYLINSDLQRHARLGQPWTPGDPHIWKAFSYTASDYLVTGLEDGMEGWRTLQTLGANVNGLSAWTTY